LNLKTNEGLSNKAAASLSNSYTDGNCYKAICGLKLHSSVIPMLYSGYDLKCIGHSESTKEQHGQINNGSMYIWRKWNAWRCVV